MTKKEMVLVHQIERMDEQIEALERDIAILEGK